MAARDTYRHATSVYDEITALYPRVREAKAFRRGNQIVHPALRVAGQTPSVDRDGVVLALVTKAITTHKAIRLLTDNGLRSDAMALVRVILENVILIEWILRDSSYRIDLYVESHELHTKHLATVAATHYTHRPEVVANARERAQRHADAVEAIFGDTQKKWARRLSEDGQSLLKENVSIEAMFDEVAQPANAAPDDEKQKSFMLDVVYFRQSGFVHSHAVSLQKIAKRIANEAVFALEVHTDDEEDCTEALRAANYIALRAVSALNQYAALGLDAAIERLDALLGSTEDPTSSPPS